MLFLQSLKDGGFEKLVMVTKILWTLPLPAMYVCMFGQIHSLDQQIMHENEATQTPARTQMGSCFVQFRKYMQQAFIVFFYQNLKNQVKVIKNKSTLSVLPSLYWLLVGFVALRPKSTAMVIAGRSVYLTTLFPGQA